MLVEDEGFIQFWPRSKRTLNAQISTFSLNQTMVINNEPYLFRGVCEYVEGNIRESLESRTKSLGYNS